MSCFTLFRQYIDDVNRVSTHMNRFDSECRDALENPYVNIYTDNDLNILRRQIDMEWTRKEETLMKLQETCPMMYRYTSACIRTIPNRYQHVFPAQCK